MKLKDDHDRWLSWDSGLQHLIVNCFKDLFSLRSCNGEEIFSTAKRKVSDMQNYELLRLFEGYEIKDEIFSMHLDKSLGPDGMNLGFYQHFWDVVGEDITSTFLYYLNNHSIPFGLNLMSIVLIPKTKQPKRITDLKPITLFNVLYKIMAKAIANRLKHVLPSIISESKNAIILGRLIIDNVMIALRLDII